MVCSEGCPSPLINYQKLLEKYLPFLPTRCIEGLLSAAEKLNVHWSYTLDFRVILLETFQKSFCYNINFKNIKMFFFYLYLSYT